MAERENPFFYKGHKFDLKPFRRDLYRLACYFLASESLASAPQAIDEADQRCGEVLGELRDEFFHDEISRILLQAASCVWVLLDESEADPEERPKYFCGQHEQPPGTIKQLTLREACNKIIHAQKINYDEGSIDHSTSLSPWHQPFVYLYGTQGNKTWKAHVDIIRFVKHAVGVLRFRTLNDYIQYQSAHGTV